MLRTFQRSNVIMSFSNKGSLDSTKAIITSEYFKTDFELIDSYFLSFSNEDRLDFNSICYILPSL